MKKVWSTVFALLAMSVLGFGVLSFSGTLDIVSTRGNSMEPRIKQGDMVLVKKSPTYEVGDSAAYWSDQLKTVVLHRIVAIEDGEYTFQGDNNSWLDPETPTEGKLIGKEFLHIPHGGLWLDRITSPVTLGVLAFALLATGGTAAHTRRTRRRRTMSQHAARTRSRGPLLAGLPPWAGTAAAGAALVGALGAALGVAAWTTPATAPVFPTAQESQSGQSMTFSYTADVPKSAAYDDTTVTAPQPIFRKLTNDVDVQYTYQGASGKVSVAAELSTASGWSSTVPLAAQKTFTGDSYSDTVSVDLEALENRAEAAAAATGIPATQVDVKIVSTVISDDAKPFKPGLAMILTPLQLTLAGDEASLTTGGTSAPEASVALPTAPSLRIAGRDLPVSTGRILSLVMAIAALLAAVALWFLARMSAPATESAAIRRRYGQMLVKVEPMPTPEGRPVIEVVDFPTLVKLAGRYELLILHWSRSDVDTFVVQDQGTTYRYRTGTGVARSIDEALGQTV